VVHDIAVTYSSDSKIENLEQAMDHRSNHIDLDDDSPTLDFSDAYELPIESLNAASPSNDSLPLANEQNDIRSSLPIVNVEGLSTNMNDSMAVTCRLVDSKVFLSVENADAKSV